MDAVGGGGVGEVEFSMGAESFERGVMRCGVGGGGGVRVIG